MPAEAQIESFVNYPVIQEMASSDKLQADNKSAKKVQAWAKDNINRKGVSSAGSPGVWA